MASEIRVNRLSNRSGLSTITFANGGVQFSGITTFANGDFRVGTGATILNPSANEMQFHTGGSNRLTINNSGANLGTGNITAVDATFSGNVSIGKTLTYEDVKNVDSVGVVTARTGVKVTGGDFTVGTAITASSVTGNVTQDVGITTYSGSATWFKGATANKDMYWSKASGSLVFKDNAAALFGSNSDLQIYHNGSHSYITEGSGSTPGDLHIQANNLKLRNWDGGQNYLTGTSSGSVELFHDGNKKFETISTGVKVTGNLHLNGGSSGTNSYIYTNNAAGIIYQADDNGHTFQTYASGQWNTRLTILDGGNVRVPDSGKFTCGASDDFQLFHDGTNNEIMSANGAVHFYTGANIEFRKGNSSGYETILKAIPDGAVQLYHNNVLKFETVSYGVVSKGSVEIQSGSMTTADSSDSGTTNSAIFGTGSDLKIYHDGSNSFISESGTGVLKISGSAGVYINKHDNTETCAAFLHDAGCELYFNNVKKFETTSSGAKITGQIEVTTGANSFLTSANVFKGTAGQKGVYLRSALSSATTPSYSSVDDTNTGMFLPGSDVCAFTTGGTERVRIDSNGYVGINDNDSTVGLSINKFGTQPVTNGNTYPYPAGSWSTVWNTTTANSTDYWVGFVGGYDKSTATVNISLSPHHRNLSEQCGIYIAAEATSTSASDFTIGKIIAGSQTGASASAGNQRATKSEMLRITSSGLVKVTNDLMVQGTVYGGNGARRNWFDNGAMNVIQRYQNCHVVGNYHSYGWAIDRFQNRGGNSQWQRSTNVPSGKGFDYALKVGSGTGGAVCQGIELMNQGKPGPFAVGTFWCISFWSTQPVNTASNNGFCQDLGGTNYIPLSLRTPSSGNAYAETGETASGTASGTYKRYYAIFEVTSGPHANNHTLNFGWAFNYSGSGTSEWTGFQCEQVPNASCKPSDYEHVDYATDLKRCQRYCWRSTACRYVNGYKRHDSQVNFGIQCPVPMTPYTVSNGGGTIGVVAWDYGTLTDFGGVWQNPAGTAIGLYEMDYNNGYCVIHLTTAYTGCSHCVVPSWESAQFEVACGPF